MKHYIYLKLQSWAELQFSSLFIHYLRSRRDRGVELAADDAEGEPAEVHGLAAVGGREDDVVGEDGAAAEGRVARAVEQAHQPGVLVLRRRRPADDAAASVGQPAGRAAGWKKRVY